ncbi:hypothetical protein F8M41_018425 [Gigaspora margarita]|uniref:Uncharacterized protein n=1 Tax=Gigaspora margarita TaxID=4874 RepID=A0A8H4ELE8_GIGMA|nr:hypothetical protein F8M41_018425 [Gigaspora margarita]
MCKEGCSIYWKYIRKLADKQLIPCSESECKQYTRSNSGRCPIHIRGYYTSQYYYKLQNGVVSIQEKSDAMIRKAIDDLLLELSENLFSYNS